MDTRAQGNLELPSSSCRVKPENILTPLLHSPLKVIPERADHLYMIYNVLVIKINFTNRIDYTESLHFEDKSIVVSATDNILDTMEAIYRGNIDILFLPDSRGSQKTCLYIRMIKAYYESLDIAILTEDKEVSSKERELYIQSGGRELLNAYDFEQIENFIKTRKKLTTAGLKGKSWSECTTSAIMLIKENYHKRETLVKIVTSSGYSYSSVCHLVKKDTGINPSEWLIRERMKGAAELLISTQLPVKEVAWKNGYDSLQGFTRAFKREKGLSPNEFRKVNRRKLYDKKEEE